mmetsp:Transcript_39896/g.113948  ORF Transcript_39896/g.113948 Transcript_39896/m.113948 type:complete len:223 (+) Transcript_39896:172-840(+)
MLVARARQPAVLVHPTRVPVALALGRPGLAVPVSVLVRHAVAAPRTLPPGARARLPAGGGGPQPGAVDPAGVENPLAADLPAADAGDQRFCAALHGHHILRLVPVRVVVAAGVGAVVVVVDAGQRCEALDETILGRAPARGALPRPPAVLHKDLGHVVIQGPVIRFQRLPRADAVVDAVIALRFLVAAGRLEVGVEPALDSLCKVLDLVRYGVSAGPEAAAL